jgi:tetratricopeptide (TPR) repeat protein
MLKVQFKRLFALLLALLLLCGGLAWLHAFQMQRMKPEFLRIADRAVEQGAGMRAALYLDTLLKLDPRDTAALEKMAAVQPLINNSSATQGSLLQIYERLLRVDPQRLNIRRKSAELAYQIREFSTSLAHIEKLGDVRDARMELLRGLCYLQLGDFVRAEKALRFSMELAPQEPQAHVELALMLHDRLNRSDDARNVLDSFVSQNPDLSEAYLARASCLFRWRRLASIEDLDQIERDVRSALQRDPDHVDARLLLADLQLARAEEIKTRAWRASSADQRSQLEAQSKSAIDQARTELQGVLAIAANDIRAVNSLLRLELADEQFQRAEELLKKSLADRPDILEWKEILAQLWLREGRIQDAENLVRELESLDYQSTRTAFLRCWILIANQQWREAVRQLEALRPLVATDPPLQNRVDQMLLTGYNCLGDMVQGLSARERIIQADPTAYAVREDLARSYAARDRLDEALEQYEAIPNPSPSVKLQIALVKVQQTLRRGGQRDWSNAVKAIQDAESVNPGDPNILLMKAEVVAGQGRFDEAEKILIAARDQNPQEPAFWFNLQRLYERRRDVPAITRLLAEAKIQLGDSVPMRLAEANFISIFGGPNAAQQLERLDDGVDQFSPEDQDTLWRGLSEAYTRMGDHAAALRIWRNVLKLNPDDLPALYTAFTLAYQANDLDAARGLQHNIHNMEPDGITDRIARAWLLLREARTDPQLWNTAERELADIDRQRPNWPVLQLADAELQELKLRAAEADPARKREAMNAAERAADRYLQAINLGESNPTVIRRALELLYRCNRANDAAKIMDRFRDRTEIMEPIQRIAANLSAKRADFAAALEQAERIVNVEKSTDLRDLLWLGWLRWKSGREADAERPFLRAVELAESTWDPYVQLVQYYALVGRLDRAAEVTRQLEQRLGSEGAYPLALAQCYFAMKQLDKAGRFYQLAYEADPNDLATIRGLTLFYIENREPEKAQKMLEALIQNQDESGGDVGWARQLLANLLSESRDPERVRQALRILDIDRADGLDLVSNTSANISVEDLRTRARVLVRQNTPQDQLRARIILEDLLSRGMADLDDCFLLASLHDLDGNAERVDTIMKQVMDQLANPGAGTRNLPPILAFEANRLIRRGDLDQAERVIQRLERLSPNRLQTVAVRARWLHARGNSAQAVALLERYQQSRGDLAPADLQALAAIYESVDAKSQAIDLQKRVTEAGFSDQTTFAYTEMLVRSGRSAEAIEAIKRYWNELPKTSLSSLLIRLYYRGITDQSARRQLAAWIEQAAREEPNARECQLNLAILKTLTGDYAEAESIYRALIALDTADNLQLSLKAKALANLAWLLAFRPQQQEEARQCIDQAVSLIGSPRPDLIDTRALIAIKQKRIADAIKDLQELTTGRTDVSPVHWFHLAQAQMIANNRDEALLSWKRALQAGLNQEKLHTLEQEAFAELARLLGTTH